jgi:hypothetical protein
LIHPTLPPTTAKSRIWIKKQATDDVGTWDAASFVSSIQAKFCSDTQWAKYVTDDHDDTTDGGDVGTTADSASTPRSRKPTSIDCTSDDDTAPSRKSTPSKVKVDLSGSAGVRIDLEPLVTSIVDASNVNAMRLAGINTTLVSAINATLASIDKSIKTVADFMIKSEKCKNVETLKRFYAEAQSVKGAGLEQLAARLLII